jgi:hypothetical protein
VTFAHVRINTVRERLVAKCADLDGFDESSAHGATRFPVVFLVVAARDDFANGNFSRPVAIHLRADAKGAQFPTPESISRLLKR